MFVAESFFKFLEKITFLIRKNFYFMSKYSYFLLIYIQLDFLLIPLSKMLIKCEKKIKINFPRNQLISLRRFEIH